MVGRVATIGALLVGCGLLAGCGGSGGDTPAASTATPAATSAADAAAAAAAAKTAKEADADRLAKQATFGPTAAVVDRIVSLGVAGWLDEQFAATGSTYSDLVTSIALKDCYNSASCMRRNFTREQVAMRFYADALGQPDQLRQRVAFALSQTLVAANTSVNATAGLAAYQQILLDGAFGNYRDLLTKVTLNCYMGTYLDMAWSHRVAPSENYAREFLQLFTMGPNKLNMDGSLVTDASGAATPNYTPDDVRGVARALTGWVCPRLNGAVLTDATQVDYTQPMIQVAARYDTAAKSFLGTTVPANAAQTDSVAGVVDAAFNNASTPPFVARGLIRHLVTANPSAAYVGRVAAVFVNNGSNVRGDLKAVVRAILTDSEARGATAAGANPGKVKEPVLLLTSIARAAAMTGDGYAFTVRDTALGQPVFAAPSVFNFYPPDFPLPQSTTLGSPASKLMNTAFTIRRGNLVYDWTIDAASRTSEFASAGAVENAKGSTQDWSAWEAFGTDTDAMIDRIDYLFLNRTLTAAQKSALQSAAAAITDAAAATQARKRAQAMLFVVLASPLFQVDR